MYPFLDNKTKEQIELRLGLENPYQTSSLKDRDISREVFEQKLERYRARVGKMKKEPKELFKYFERKKLYLIKMLRGGERNQRVGDDSSSQKEQDNTDCRPSAGAGRRKNSRQQEKTELSCLQKRLSSGPEFVHSSRLESLTYSSKLTKVNPENFCDGLHAIRPRPENPPLKGVSSKTASL